MRTSPDSPSSPRCCSPAAFTPGARGLPDADEGSASSPSSAPGSQRPLETHRDQDGKVRTEDGRPVNNRDGDATHDGRHDDSPEHDSPGGPQDPSTDPGTLEH